MGGLIQLLFQRECEKALFPLRSDSLVLVVHLQILLQAILNTSKPPLSLTRNIYMCEYT